jgi:Raf kinase inhibitor-like YbhB/YbcL family protein
MKKEFLLLSTAFKHTEEIPQKHTAYGDNINPSLQWGEVPYDTKSFALIVDDPDSVEGVRTLWLVKDIPADKRSIDENSVPGIEVVNSSGKKSWSGPDIPYGKHRYFFRLYALNTKELDADDIHHFYRQVEKHKLGEAVLMGKFSKD